MVYLDLFLLVLAMLLLLLLLFVCYFHTLPQTSIHTIEVANAVPLSKSFKFLSLSLLVGELLQLHFAGGAKGVLVGVWHACGILLCGFSY